MLRKYKRCFTACSRAGGCDVVECNKVGEAAKAPLQVLEIRGGTTGIRKLDWSDVVSLTCGFTTAVVGEGGSSTVYLAGGGAQLAAVKVHRSSERLHRVFLQELDALRRLRHPHVVTLIAYCVAPGSEDGALVLEFVPNGNLHEKLHGVAAAMPWTRRAVVALQVARALQYLHDECELQVVHGDVKSANVLLDAAMDAKLCDLGSARMGFSAAVRPRHAMVGSPGYVDPHYLRCGVVTVKTDVYSFGVLILELVTGMQAWCADKGMTLAAAVIPAISGGHDVGSVVDRRLGKEYDREEARAAVALAARCVADNPSLRPSMAEVARTLEEKMTASISAVRCRSGGCRCC